jgi:hypothetical protein
VSDPEARLGAPEGFDILGSPEEAGRRAVALVGGSPCDPPAPGLRLLRLARDGAQALFLANEGESAIETSLALPGKGRLEAWEPWTGSVVPIARAGGRVRIRLGYRESLFLCGEDGLADKEPAEEGPSEDYGAASLPSGGTRDLRGDSLRISLEPWTTAGFPEGAAPPESLGAWNEVPRLERFVGSVVYRTRFVLDPADFLAGEDGTAVLCGELFLDLGEVGEMAIASVNGTEAGMRMWRPYGFELGRLARPGENELGVEVRNNVAARYGGTPVRAGLIGPARLALVKRRKGDEMRRLGEQRNTT